MSPVDAAAVLADTPDELAQPPRFMGHAFLSGIQTGAIRKALDQLARGRTGNAQIVLQEILDIAEAQNALNERELAERTENAWWNKAPLPTVTPPAVPVSQRDEE